MIEKKFRDTNTEWKKQKVSSEIWFYINARL